MSIPLSSAHLFLLIRLKIGLPYFNHHKGEQFTTVTYCTWHYYLHFSGASRVWQAWLVPWAPRWWGRNNCLANIKISDLELLEPLFCAPYTDWLQCCINTAPLSYAGRAAPASSSIMIRLWYCDTTGRSDIVRCDRTRTLTCHIYKTSSFLTLQQRQSVLLRLNARRL